MPVPVQLWEQGLGRTAGEGVLTSFLMIPIVEFAIISV